MDLNVWWQHDLAEAAFAVGVVVVLVPVFYWWQYASRRESRND